MRVRRIASVYEGQPKVRDERYYAEKSHVPLSPCLNVRTAHRVVVCAGNAYGQMCDSQHILQQ